MQSICKGKTKPTTSLLAPSSYSDYQVQFFLVLELDSMDCSSFPPSLTHMEVGRAAMWQVTEGKHRAPSQILFLVFAYLYVLCTCISYATCTGCHGPEKVIRFSGSVTQAAVSFLIWVLGTELDSFGRIASPLNSWRAGSGCSCRDPGLIPSTHSISQVSKSSSRGTQHCLLASEGTRHVCGTHNTQAKK